MTVLGLAFKLASTASHDALSFAANRSSSIVVIPAALSASLIARARV